MVFDDVAGESAMGCEMKARSTSGNLELVLTIALAMGVMSFEQGSLGYLLPFIQPDLRLTNTEIGAAASTYWAAFALASYGMGILADSRGGVRRYLIAVLAVFGVCSLLSGLVGGFGSLLLVRAIMGVLAGALLTLTQSLLGLSSPPAKVGANMGLAMGLGGSLSGLIIAPLVLVQVASAFGWRVGYFIIAAPAWLAAVLVWTNVREPSLGLGTTAAAGLRGLMSGLAEVLRYRNIQLCALLCSFYVAYVGLGMTFLPLFFVRARGFSPTRMSTLVAVLGASSLLFSIVLPAISDRFGRKRVLVAACGLGMLTPLAAYAYHGPPIVLGALLFIGWSMAGTGSFFMGIIPSETVQGAILSRALGSVIALGVLLGGLVGPLIAGWSGDRMGAGAPLVVQGACAAFGMLAALALRETAPRRSLARDDGLRSPQDDPAANPAGVAATKSGR